MCFNYLLESEDMEHSTPPPTTEVVRRIRWTIRLGQVTDVEVQKHPIWMGVRSSMLREGGTDYRR
jgi:hypothetical protein